MTSARRSHPDCRSLHVWQEARSLTLAAFQMVHEQEAGTPAHLALSDIHRSCLAFLSVLYHLTGTPLSDPAAIREAKRHVLRVEDLLLEAAESGAVREDDLDLLEREIRMVRSTLREVAALAT